MLDEEQVNCLMFIVEMVILFYVCLGYCSICLDEDLGLVCNSVFVYGGGLDIGGEISIVVEMYNGVQFMISDWSDLFVWSG